MSEEIPIGPGTPKIPTEDEARDSVRAGMDEIERREKAMGLDIDPKTGRAYEDQGSFENLGLGAGGRFYNGKAVPRVMRCDACEGRVVEDAWGRGFRNCGGFDFGGQFFLCPECVLKALKLFPRIRGIVAAMHGGDLKRG